MQDWEWIELFKGSVAMLQEKEMNQLLRQDRVYEENSIRESQLEEEYMAIREMLGKHKEIIDELLQVRDKENCDCNTWSFIAGVKWGFKLAKIMDYS